VIFLFDIVFSSNFAARNQSQPSEMTIKIHENRSSILARDTRAKLSNNPTSLLLLIAAKMIRRKA
jgi:hypothetical protein